ncbi:MAG: alpha/beta hydrolase [Oligoflexales bacterium]|nr:alpha/beta hydrolase [Oligoflexales bacterium]
MKINKVKGLSFFCIFLIGFINLSCKIFSNKASDLAQSKACKFMYDGFLAKDMQSKSLPKNFTSFKEVSFKDYCNDNIFADKMADGLKKEGDQTPWSKSWGSGLKITVHKQTQYSLPYYKTVIFKTVNNCSLGMQIYLENLDDLSSKKLKPFMFIHGGGWMIRQFTSTTAVESFIPHLTSKGYVVFSPSYRLLREIGGPKECQKSNGTDIQEDMKSAFAWVKEHSESYGSLKNQKIGVGGQSAGAHLATFLLTEYPKEVSQGILFYPVTDFKYMIGMVKNGEFGHMKEDATLAHYVYGEGSPLIKMDENNKIVERNSFPDIIRKEPTAFPPVYMIHGNRDTIAPVVNSERLCSAYNQNFDFKIETLHEGKRQQCGPKGYFVQITNGRHMLDIRCLGKSLSAIIPSQLANSVLCPAGSIEGDNEVAKAVEHLSKNFLN